MQYAFGKEMKEKLRTEIMVSIMECVNHKRGHALQEHQDALELELNRVIAGSKLGESDSPGFTGKQTPEYQLQSLRTDHRY